MGFNPRLAPYTVSKQFSVRESSKDAAASQHFHLMTFPAKGQVIAAYANVRRVIFAATAADAGITAETATGVDEISLWKKAATDTTATYATGLRALQRTGAQNGAATGGISWSLPTVTTINGLYSLSDNNTASSARKRFGAGDAVYMHFGPYGATDAVRAHVVDVQMDYVIGYEDGSVPTLASQPAED